MQNLLIHWLTPFIWENNLSTIGGNVGTGVSIFSSTNGIARSGGDGDDDDDISSIVCTSTSCLVTFGNVSITVEVTFYWKEEKKRRIFISIEVFFHYYWRCFCFFNLNGWFINIW